MSSPYSSSELELVFGPESLGATPEERARTSRNQFVRSQLQLAPWSDGATGRILTALEALQTFGWDLVRRAGAEGSAPLVSSPNEPSLTLRRRREELGLTVQELARRVRATPAAVADAETPGIRSPIRTIEALGQALALDERMLGFRADAGRDRALGVRLREMSNNGDVAGFTPKTVLQLAEAAWVISREAAMRIQLGASWSQKVSLPQHDPSFDYPTYEIGYRLAAKTRSLLGIGAEEPIKSVRLLVEDSFGLPLIQQQMNQKFAGATMANGDFRGIVVNETGMNSNVLVRRMTLCHELGHLLWDPDDFLHRVTVDDYADLEGDYNYRESRRRRPGRDAPEVRANAFAVALLAPPTAIKDIAAASDDPIVIVQEVMSTFGISATAAVHHVRNVTKLDASGDRHGLQEPDDQWSAMENLTLDYFPLKLTPLSRRGKFSWCVAKLYSKNEITIDTAAMLLMCPANKATASALEKILELRDGVAAGA